MGDKITNVLFSGVGGQGAMLASEILALVAAEEGNDVKQTEVHGAAQRGGAVASHVRYGERVYSPVIRRGEADLLVAFEKLEALRYAHYLKDGAYIVLNDEEIEPAKFDKSRQYPKQAVEFLKGKGFKVIVVPAADKAIELGNKRVASTILLGAASGLLELKQESWQKVLDKRILPHLLEINKRAFAVGIEIAEQ